MRSNLAIALICLLLGAALAEWFSARDANAQALPPSSGGTSYTHPSAISLSNGIDSQDGGTFTGNVSTNGKFSSSAASGADGFMFDTVGARLRLGGSSNARQVYASGTNLVIIGDASSTTLFAYAIQANSSIAASNGNGVLERTSNSMQLRTTFRGSSSMVTRGGCRLKGEIAEADEVNRSQGDCFLLLHHLSCSLP